MVVMRSGNGSYEVKIGGVSNLIIEENNAVRIYVDLFPFGMEKINFVLEVLMANLLFLN
jgi:hypothetical protein